MNSSRFDHIDDPDERQRAVTLVAELEARSPELRQCAECRVGVCGHQYVLNAAMGFKDRPRCIGCLARTLGQAPTSFFERAYDYVDHRPCFRSAWDWSTEDEGSPAEGVPPCVTRQLGEGTLPAETSDPSDPEVDREPAARWDAGDMSCGDLVLALRLQLMQLAPGDRLELRATDPAAPEDLPAWCRLTGHTLISATHPRYLIQRRNG